jgi:hypothetical protein
VLGTKFYYNCNYCGAVFKEKGRKYKLIDIDDVENPIWQRYRNKPLTFDEWARIANGGMSDAEQKVMDAKERLKQKEAEKQQKKQALEAEERNKKELEARKEAIINEFLNKLATGQINLTTTTASPIIPKKGEVSTMVMHNINFLEARAVRQTVGGYGGPSIRVAKGVSFRLVVFQPGACPMMNLKR